MNSIEKCSDAGSLRMPASPTVVGRGEALEVELSTIRRRLRAALFAFKEPVTHHDADDPVAATADQVVEIREIVEVARTDVTALVSQQDTTLEYTQALRAGQARVEEILGDLALRLADLQAEVDASHSAIGGMAERLDAGFIFDVDLGLDDDRERVVGAVTSLGEEIRQQLDGLRREVEEIVEQDDASAGSVGVEALADLREELLNELVVLRRRLKVRADDGALTEEQVDAIADAVVARFEGGDRAAFEVDPTPVRSSARRPIPLSANGPGARSEGG